MFAKSFLYTIVQNIKNVGLFDNIIYVKHLHNKCAVILSFQSHTLRSYTGHTD